MRIIDRYGSAANFLRVFAPGNTDAYTRTDDFRRRCVTGGAPSLAVVANAYDPETAEIWLNGLFKTLYEACGQIVPAKQIEALTTAVMCEFDYLKVTDLMLFSVKVRAGAYGHFYGDADITRIGDALQQYCRWRQSVIEDEERRRAKEHAEEARRERNRGISLTEYLQTPGLDPQVKTFLSRFADTFDARDVNRE